METGLTYVNFLLKSKLLRHYIQGLSQHDVILGYCHSNSFADEDEPEAGEEEDKSEIQQLNTTHVYF